MKPPRYKLTADLCLSILSLVSGIVYAVQAFQAARRPDFAGFLWWNPAILAAAAALLWLGFAVVLLFFVAIGEPASRPGLEDMRARLAAELRASGDTVSSKAWALLERIA